MREALQLLCERAAFNHPRHEALCGDIAIGIDQADRGEVAPLGMEEIKAEGQRCTATARTLDGIDLRELTYAGDEA